MAAEVVTMTNKRIEDTLKNLSDTLSQIEKHIRPKTTKPDSLFKSGEVIAQVPAELDWVTPEIKGEVSFIRNSDGRVTLTMEISGEDAAIAEDFLTRGVEYLQISSMTRP